MINITEKLNPGDFVKAPFGANEITGVVWLHEQKTEKKFKLSEKNNHPEIALRTHRELLGQNLELYVADRYQESGCMEVLPPTQEIQSARQIREASSKPVV